MRFNYPVMGDTRVIKKFAFLPVRAGDEIRWLETKSFQFIPVGLIFVL